jgi:hypothetical protein
VVIRSRSRQRQSLTWLVLLGFVLVLSGAHVPRAAAADGAAAQLDTVRSALAGDPVYVARDAEAAPLVNVSALRRSIGDARIVVAVLPNSARAATNGSVDDLPRAIGGERAVVVLCGRSLRAAASSSVLPSGRAGQLARQAQQDHAGAFDAANVQGALQQVVGSLKQQLNGRGSAGSPGGSSAGGTSAGDSSGGSALPWVLGGLAVLGGGGYLLSRRRKAARRAQAELDAERAEVNSLYGRLGADVSNLDPGDDATARQAMADASERYTAGGALLSQASGSGELAAARHALVEGLHAARVARQRLGLDAGPPIPEPEPADRPQLEGPQQVAVGGNTYNGYPTYAPGAPYYYPGGVLGGGYVPGGWYGSRFWEGALLGGLAGSVLTGGLGGFGGYGFGGFGGGYGAGYDSGYDRGYERGVEAGDDDNGGDWSGGGDWAGGGDWSGGGDWGGGDNSGGGDW